ncbi:MAG TPA: bifunctional riboflavin kinase/FAD synthetase [Candidatus Dormibacteraeota bacterium]
MELFHELPVREAGGDGSVVTIGSFDGVHIGHRRLIRRVRETADRAGLRSTVVTFEPHPRCVVDPSGCPPMLSSLAERMELLELAGAQRVVVLAFTQELRSWSAARFADALVERLGMRRLLVGPGFALGRGREGTVDFLRDLGRKRRFTVTSVAPSMRGGSVVSSGRIREAIATGKFADAIAMLGRPYVLEGPVARGDGRGAGLGVPTANLRVDPGRCIPSAGVYAGWLDAGDGWRPAATGIGTRPTFGGGSVTVEAHVLDFDGDLYDRDVRLALVRRLRPELAFDSVAALVAAMARDIARTRNVLARSRPPR